MAKIKALFPTRKTAKAGWNVHLPEPLIYGERVLQDKNQEGVGVGYVRVRHGKSFKTISVFSKNNFK